MSKVRPYLLFALLLSSAITTGSLLQPLAQSWDRKRESGSLLQSVMGDGRRLFANHFFTKADISFHSGYYPSIFDQRPGNKSTAHLTGEDDEHDAHDGTEHAAGTAAGSQAQAHAEPAGHEESDHATQHEKDMAFLGKPKDWIESFGRNFLITEHKHLQGGTEREMLPWLKIAAELNPESPETYTVAAYWLREMKKTKEAEDFLREGLKSCPNSHELYFDLGDLYYRDYKDVSRARNLWEIALKKWRQAPDKEKENKIFLDRVALNLASLEESQGNIPKAIQYLQIAREGSPNPEAIDARIAELKAKAPASPGTGSTQ